MSLLRRPHLLARRSAQGGAALLLAMVIVTVVATIASSMVWQQWRAVQVESAERGREQLQWLLVGAVDFTRLILMDDGQLRQTNGNYQPTYLGQNWAKELKEVRISAFLAVDKDNTTDAPDAFMSGKVVDGNSRYNLRNLLTTSAIVANPTATAPPFQVDPAQVKVLSDLFNSLDRIPPTLAQQIADALEQATLAAMNTNTAFTALGSQAARDNAPIMPQKLDHLPWLVPGIDPSMIERMRPYVTLEPYDPAHTGMTTVNLNTASKEVIGAVWGIGAGAAGRIVGNRSQPFDDLAQVQSMMPNVPMPSDAFDVQSNYFEVTGMLRLESQIMKQRTLVRRDRGGRQVDVTVMSQENFSGIDTGN